jgi:hypothetical protein
MSAAFIDRQRLQQLLLDGEKVAAVASALRCCGGSVSHAAREMGLRHVCTTSAERVLLADLRAGRAVIVRAENAPASAALIAAMESALRTYHSSVSVEASA